MKLVSAFLKLIRWPNILFIVLTQFLFFYAIIEPKLKSPVNSFFGLNYLIWLVVASVLIAAAGYIINDYFDLNIDSINKPGRLVIDKMIKRRWAILLHMLLSGIGVLISFYISFKFHYWWLGFANLLCCFLLFGYSITLKRKLLIGNILISGLTAWVIMVVYFCYIGSFTSGSFITALHFPPFSNSLTRIAFLYAGFAFIISLIREVIKDMEDMEGDARFGCKTMPIVWGIPASKVFVAVWIIVLIAVLGIVQYYVLQFGWWWSAVYCLLLVIAPLLWILYQLHKAQVPKDYRRLSAAVKLVMFTGIMSMLFFRIYS